jgi:hypothetical protein
MKQRRRIYYSALSGPRIPTANHLSLREYCPAPLVTRTKQPRGANPGPLNLFMIIGIAARPR